MTREEDNVRQNRHNPYWRDTTGSETRMEIKWNHFGNRTVCIFCMVRKPCSPPMWCVSSLSHLDSSRGSEIYQHMHSCIASGQIMHGCCWRWWLRCVDGCLSLQACCFQRTDAGLLGFGNALTCTGSLQTLCANPIQIYKKFQHPILAKFILLKASKGLFATLSSPVSN